jgi:hypothetical protein
MVVGQNLHVGNLGVRSVADKRQAVGLSLAMCRNLATTVERCVERGLHYCPTERFIVVVEKHLAQLL